MALSARVDPERLIDFATAVYESAGMPHADARLVADTLVQADLWGHQYIAEIKAVPRAQGFDEVFYPGEIEARNDERNRGDGIEFPDDTLADLRRIAKETGLEARLSL